MYSFVLNKSIISKLVCPSCLISLNINKISDKIIEGLMECPKCNNSFNVKFGIPNLVKNEKTHKYDILFSKQADNYGRYYDLLLKIMSIVMLNREAFTRKMLINYFPINNGNLILDISTGTGVNLFPLSKKVGKEGTVIGLDLSQNMLSIARKKLIKKKISNVMLNRADACYLPYKDNVFDGVISTGGFNTFGQKERAFKEIIRVTKPGYPIVIVDEGLSPKKLKSLLGKILVKSNALYRCQPPVYLIPKSIPFIKKWIWGGMFYLIAFNSPE